MPFMMGLNPILLGVTALLIIATIGSASFLSAKTRPVFIYGLLALMVGVYVGFALVAFDSAEFVTRAVLSVLMVESLTALVFLFAGLAVVNSDRPWLLGVLILAHGGVDLLHLLLDAAHSPDWYEFLCLIYDAVVGVAAIWLLSEKTVLDPTERNPETTSSQ